MNYGRSDFDADRWAQEEMHERDYRHGFRYSSDNSFLEAELQSTEKEIKDEKDNNNPA